MVKRKEASGKVSRSWRARHFPSPRLVPVTRMLSLLAADSIRYLIINIFY